MPIASLDFNTRERPARRGQLVGPLQPHHGPKLRSSVSERRTFSFNSLVEGMDPCCGVTQVLLRGLDTGDSRGRIRPSIVVNATSFNKFGQ